MASDKLRLFGTYLPIMLKYALTILHHRIQVLIHRHTYHASPSALNVVIIGGSFSGAFLAWRLAESLPSGYKVVLVEQNSHFNYTFNFPRYSVVQGREQRAFIPYAGLFAKVPQGSFEQVHDAVESVGEGEVRLASGTRIPFAFLAIATGATQSPPAKLLASEKREECAELRVLQERIRAAKSIAIVGGGAVGVQLAADIRSFYADKKITLIHSREHLLPSFGKRLHEYVLEKLQGFDVEVVLGERPVLPKTTTTWQAAELVFKDGRTESFDLVIPCTGQTPNSSIIEHLSPTSISALTQRILVKPTLQLKDDTKLDAKLTNIFAVGDVAETGGPKMARAGLMQAEIARNNIVALIRGKSLRDYVPVPLEASLKLSLGKNENVMYMQDSRRDFLIPGKSSNVDLEAEKAWKFFGADFKSADF